MSGEVTVPLELSNRVGGSEAALAPKILSISSKKGQEERALPVSLLLSLI